jgi:sulfate adenylyltransferase subunit 2
MTGLSSLNHLESEAIQILRDGVAEAENPVLLFSGGKDSTVLAHLALRAFYPSKPPLPLLHVDSTWEFDEVVAFRDRFAREHGFELRTYHNAKGREMGLNPIHHGDTYTTMMRTDALKQALDEGGYDVIFGGARRDEEATRAKERVVSVRGTGHTWDPKNQRPELWSNYNWRRTETQTLRAYPISNWTEFDLWTYLLTHRIELCPLYFAAERPVVDHQGQLIVINDTAASQTLGFANITQRTVRFRSLGCWPVTAAVDSQASDLDSVVAETLMTTSSERSGRVSDSGSLEDQKRQGYF